MKAQITLWPNELLAVTEDEYRHLGHWDDELDRLEVIGMAVDAMLAAGVDTIEFIVNNSND